MTPEQRAARVHHHLYSGEGIVEHAERIVALEELAFGMYGLLEMFDKMLGNHDACETPRPLVFGEDKSFKDVMRELGVEVDE